MKIAVNIGLGNNPVPVEQIVNAFKIFFGRDVQWRVDDEGAWKGEGEETLVLLLDGVYLMNDEIDTEIAFHSLMVSMCDTLTQDSIAYYVYDLSEGDLAFRGFENKEGIEFSMKHFIEL
jgi:hypothetical protein